MEVWCLMLIIRGRWGWIVKIKIGANHVSAAMLNNKYYQSTKTHPAVAGVEDEK